MRQLYIIVLSIICLTLINSTLAQGLSLSATYQVISASELRSQQSQDPQLLIINVDGLYRGEISGTHIYVPFNRLEEFFIILPKDKTRAIVVYSLDMGQTTNAAQSLVAMGYRNVRILSGSSDLWQQAGLNFFDTFANSGNTLPTGSIDMERLSSYLGTPRNRFVTSDAANATVKNVANSRLYLVEYSDFNCPYCSRFHSDTYPLLEQYYFNTGAVNYLHRDFVSVGGNASQQAAELLECAREQIQDHRYFDILQSIYLSQGRKNVNSVRSLLSNYQLDNNALETCFSQQRYTQNVHDGREAARQAGIRGTPGFVLGYMNEQGIIEGIRISGAVPFQTFQEYIDLFMSVQN